MTMQEFIQRNREEVDQVIKRICPKATLDDKKRWLWILNTGELYEWAKACGVRTH